MPTTPTLLLPYPLPGDPADVPLDMQELAERIEAVRGASTGLASLGADGKVPAAQLPAGGSAGEISYAQIVAQVNVSVLTEATGVVVITAAAYVSDGVTPILVEFFSPLVRTPNVATHAIVLTLWLDGAAYGRLAQLSTPAAAEGDSPIYVSRRLVPAAGSRVFSVRAHVTTGTGGVYAGPGGTPASQSPAYIRLSKA